MNSASTACLISVLQFSIYRPLLFLFAVPASNMVMKTLIEKPNVKILTEKILLLLNRGGELWESCHLLTFQHHFTTSFLYILKMKGIFPYLQSTLKLLPRFYRVVVWCYRLYAWTLVFEIIHFSHLWNTMVTLCHERDLSQRWSRMDCTKWLHTVAQNETKSQKRRLHFCAFAKWTAWWWICFVGPFLMSYLR